MPQPAPTSPPSKPARRSPQTPPPTSPPNPAKQHTAQTPAPHKACPPQPARKSQTLQSPQPIPSPPKSIRAAQSAEIHPPAAHPTPRAIQSQTSAAPPFPKAPHTIPPPPATSPTPRNNSAAPLQSDPTSSNRECFHPSSAPQKSVHRDAVRQRLTVQSSCRREGLLTRAASRPAVRLSPAHKAQKMWVPAASLDRPNESRQPHQQFRTTSDFLRTPRSPVESTSRSDLHSENKYAQIPGSQSPPVSRTNRRARQRCVPSTTESAASRKIGAQPSPDPTTADHWDRSDCPQLQIGSNWCN